MELSFDNLIPVLKQAGEAILKVYNSTEKIQVDFKADDSPVTVADQAANDLIVAFLSKNFPYPIVSEEGKEIPYESRKNYETFWLVDPLDGTKESNFWSHICSSYRCLLFWRHQIGFF